MTPYTPGVKAIVADIGGTKVNLARARAAGAKVELTQLRSYASAASDSFTAVLQRYLDDEPEASASAGIEVAAFAVAGPVMMATNSYAT